MFDCKGDRYTRDIFGTDSSLAQAIEDLGLAPQPAKESIEHQWKYTTLSDAPPLHPDAKNWSSALYRGIVPAKHIDRCDFAVNGAVVSPEYPDDSRER